MGPRKKKGNKSSNKKKTSNASASASGDADSSSAASVPESPEAVAAELKAEGNKHYVAHEYKEAIELYSKAIELVDTIPAYYGNRAAAYLMQGQYQKTIQDCKKAIEIDDKFAKAWLRRGKAETHLGKLREAQISFKKVLELEHGNSDASSELQAVKKLEKDIALTEEELSSNKGKATNCLKRLGEAVNTSSRWDRIKVLRGKALFQLKRFAECASEMGFVIRSNASNSDALYLRGMSLYNMGNIDQAVSHLRNALQSDPDHADARNAIKMVRGISRNKEEGNAAFKAGKWQAAVDSYSTALTFDPANVDTNSKLYANRAAALAKLSRFEDAIADCTEAIKMDAKYVKAYLRRGDLYLQTKDFESAVRDITKASQLSDSQDIAKKLRDAKLALKKSKRKDYYKILGITEQATGAEIKKGYKRMALKWHPDKNSGSEEERAKAEGMFKDITEAFEILNDAQKKRKYDAGQDLEDIEHGGGFGGHGHSHFHEADIFNMFFGGGFGRGGGGFHEF